MRRLLQPLLKLFFNPNPLIQAMHTQTQINQAALAREAERDRRQAEWNALHYDILQRLVTEISRTSLEAQGLSMRVESLAAKVDFNERRVRGLENTLHQARPAPRPSDSAAPPPPPPTAMPSRESGPPETPAADGGVVREGSPEGGRRRRRRRRGRRSPMGTPFEGGAPPVAGGEQSVASGPPGEIDIDSDMDEDEDEPVSSPEVDTTTASSPTATPPEPAYVVESFAPSATPSAPHVPAAGEPTSAEPTPPAPVSETASDEPRAPDPHEPSDSGTG